MFPATFVSPPKSSLSLGLEGLHHNLLTIGADLPPPAVVSSLGRASTLAQGMGEGLSAFAGQVSGEWICVDCCVFLVGYRGGVGGCHCHGMLIVSLFQKDVTERWVLELI